jgi:aspartate-semialdehyde dehydrogenase
MTRLAIVGGSSEVATDLIDVLAERGFDLSGLRVIGDESLAGEGIEAAGYDVRVEQARPGCLAGIDVAVFLGSGKLAGELVDEARDEGAIVLDATPHSCANGAPVVLPEVNAGRVASLDERLLAIPGAHGVGLAVALAPLHEAAGVKRVVTTVFDSASVHGREAMDALSQQSVRLMQGRGLAHDEFPEQLAFNARPQVASRVGNGWSFDEARLAHEIGALFDGAFDVVATVVRVPVFAGAAQSVYVELERPLAVEDAERVLREGRGILMPEPRVPDAHGDGVDDVDEVADDDAYDDDAASDPAAADDPGSDEQGHDLLHDEVPGPVEVGGSEAVHVARVRAAGQGLAFWIAFDELRKGTSLSVVATLEIALRDLP